MILFTGGVPGPGGVPGTGGVPGPGEVPGPGGGVPGPVGSPGLHPSGKLRGIRSKPTPKGEIEGDQVQAHTQGGN